MAGKRSAAAALCARTAPRGDLKEVGVLGRGRALKKGGVETPSWPCCGLTRLCLADRALTPSPHPPTHTRYPPPPLHTPTATAAILTATITPPPLSLPPPPPSPPTNSSKHSYCWYRHQNNTLSLKCAHSLHAGAPMQPSSQIH